ncbi:MAG: ribbon-helix-helix protein, CopG family [Chloroflexi bacterium]|nr:ribbon-helix-helix protein, CopG family [Chloroflexota bacterium]
MDRTTLTIPAELRIRLRRLAADRGVSMAKIVREAIDEKLAGARPRPRSMGIGASGSTDVARRSADERPEPRSWR